MRDKNKQSGYPERVHSAGVVKTINFESTNLGHVECDYLAVTPEADNRKTDVLTIVVPGFTEGVVAGTHFGKALSDELGGDVLVVDQYSRENKKFTSPDAAITSQAKIILGLIEQAEATEKPVNIVASSMGGIIFARAAELAAKRGWTCFAKNSGIVFISPAGTKSDETKQSLLKRYVEEFSPLGNKEWREQWDKDSLDAGPDFVISDPKKSLAEALAVANTSVDYNRLKALGIMPRIITNPNDKLFGQDALGKSIIELLEGGKIESWSTPWRDPSSLGPNNTANDMTQHSAHATNEVNAERAAAAATRVLEAIGAEAPDN